MHWHKFGCWPGTGAALATGKLEQVLFGRHLGWPYQTTEAKSATKEKWWVPIMRNASHEWQLPIFWPDPRACSPRTKILDMPETDEPHPFLRPFLFDAYSHGYCWHWQGKPQGWLQALNTWVKNLETPHPVAKEKGLVSSKSYLQINTLQDPTKEVGFHFLCKQVSSYLFQSIVSVRW